MISIKSRVQISDGYARWLWSNSGADSDVDHSDGGDNYGR